MKSNRAVLFCGASLGLFLLGGMPRAQAQVLITPPPAAPAENVPVAVLPFALESDHVIVSVPLTQAGPGEKYRVPKNVRPFSLILDTGADTLILAEEAFTVRHITLPPKEKKNQTNVDGTGNKPSLSARFVSGIEMMVGDIPLRGSPLVAPMGAFVQAGIDGALGAEVFRSCVVEVDYQRKIIRLFAPEAFTPPVSGSGFVTVPIQFVGENKDPVITVEVTPYGFNKTKANLKIDTGASGTITFHAPFVKRNGWQAFAPKTVPSVGYGLNGFSDDRRGRLKQISLGGVTFAAPYADFSFATQGMLSTEECDGLVGGAILRRFTVIFDYSKSVLYLRPNTTLALPFPYRYYGFSPALSATASGWSVLNVAADSPAARAGIKKGDVISAVDKQSITTITLDTFYNLLQGGKAGERIFSISDAKGEKRRDVRVTPTTL